MKKFLLMLFFMLCNIISMSAQITFGAKPFKGIYLIDAQNVHLEDGQCVATEGRVHNNQYAVQLYVYVSVTGWPINSEWSNVHLNITENGVEKEIDIKSLGTDIDAYNFFTIETNGNTSYVKFAYVFYVDELDNIYDLQWELKADKNGKSHHCVIGVSRGGIITGVDDIDLPQKKEYINILGYISDRPFDGINIVKETYLNGKTKFYKILN